MNRNAYYKNYHLHQKYGISLKQKEELLKKQDGKCLICGNTFKNLSHNLHVDHNHITKKVRGLLCSQCNCGLGMFSEDISILVNAINYLKDSSL